MIRAWAVAALLALPLLLVDVPPLLDYPNHLARLFLLAHGAGDPMLAPMFRLQWAVIPNLAIDLLGPPLLAVLPVHVAGRLLAALALLLPFLGVVAYSRALFGAWHAWPLAAALVAHGGGFLPGFLNFQIGVGLALLLAAGWIAGRERRPAATVALATLGMGALFFCHLMAVLFALVLIGAQELARGSADRSLKRRLLALLPPAALPAALYLASPLGGQAGAIEYLPLSGKIAQLLWPFTGYALTLDILAASGATAAVLGAALAGRLRAPASSRIALAALAGLYAAAPYAFKGTQSLDARFTLMLALLLFAGLLPRPPRAAGTALAGLAAARIALLAAAWHGHAATLVGLRTALAGLPPGARVLAASVAPEEAPGWWAAAPLALRLSNGTRTDTHLPALALIEHRAFWPLLFNEPSQQPVAWTRSYQALADQAGSLIDHLALKPAQLCGYDRLLLLEAGADPGWRPAGLILLRAEPAAALFAIDPC